MRTSKDYLEKLAKMRPNIYMDGEVIGRDHPSVVLASNGIQRTFDLVDDPEFKELLTATSHISGKTINRFTHIHQNPEDLLKSKD
jgi:aromatic ring hydroxylase